MEVRFNNKEGWMYLVTVGLFGFFLAATVSLAEVSQLGLDFSRRLNINQKKKLRPRYTHPGQ